MKKSYEEHKQHTFDSFCKRIVKNEMRDYYDEINRRRQYEISFSELSAKELEQLSACDEYFTGEHHTFRVLDSDVVVQDEAIAAALNSLP